MPTFGSRLRAARDAAGLTQIALGLRAGMSSQTVSNYERDAVESPKSHHIVSLARVLGVTTSDLLGDVVPDSSGDDETPEIDEAVRAAAEKKGLDSAGVRKLAILATAIRREIGEPEDWHLLELAARIRRNADEAEPAKGRPRTKATKRRGRPRRRATA